MFVNIKGFAHVHITIVFLLIKLSISMARMVDIKFLYHYNFFITKDRYIQNVQLTICNLQSMESPYI